MDIREIVDKIKNFPEPLLLNILIKKIVDKDKKIDFNQAKSLVLCDFLKNSKLPIIIRDHVKLNSSAPCELCEENINSGYFKINSYIFQDKPIKNSKQIVLSYKTFHLMDEHNLYQSPNVATNENHGELIMRNENNAPRDRINIDILRKQIKNYSLPELHKILGEMIN
jgi:hypothetical protein